MRHRIRLMLLPLCLLYLPAAIAAPPVNTNWRALGNAPAVQYRNVEAMAQQGQDLYISGFFQQVGNVAAKNIAHWDGVQWRALGSGIDPTVKSMAIDSAGDLYVAGTFSLAGEVTVQGLARWNGSQWSAVNNDTDGIYALAFNTTGQLYAAGGFTTMGGTPANNVAMWDGSHWSALGSGVADGVSAMALDGQGNVYVGVCLADYVNTEIDYLHGYVARWDGSSWQILGGNTSLGCIDWLATNANGEVFASGERGNNGIESTYSTHWNGSAWSVMPRGMYSVTHLVTHPNGDLYAVGRFTTPCDGGIPYCFKWIHHLIKWDGSQWQSMGAELQGGGAKSLLFDSVGNLFVGGSLYTFNGEFSALVAKWLLVDSDSDGDGVPDIADAFPDNSAEWLDTDNDGIGNNADTDDDNDSVPDYIDADPLNAVVNTEKQLLLNENYKGASVKESVLVQ